MKGLNWRGWILFITVFSGLFLNSCKDFNDPKPKSYTYFVSNESKAPVTSQEIKLQILLAQNLLPEVAPFAELVKSDINVQKIIYKTPFQGKNIKASGLVYLPQAPGNYPVLCFQNGTNTQHSEAPSVVNNSETLFMLQSVASMGYIVVIPDFIGFGESSELPHPFLHAESTIQSILTMLRATKEFTAENTQLAQPTKDLLLFGYSQGAWATLLVQKEIETSYASEFNLVASACVAGPYCLEYMNDYITCQTEYASPYFLTSIINSYTSLGMVSNTVSDFIREPYASRIPGLFDGTHSGSNINSYLTVKTDDLLTPEYKNEYLSNPKFDSFKSALKANSVKTEDWQVATPTRLYHGEQDQSIPLALSEKTVLDLKKAGTLDSKIELITLPNVGHTDGILPVGVLTVLWFMEFK